MEGVLMHRFAKITRNEYSYANYYIPVMLFIYFNRKDWCL